MRHKYPSYASSRENLLLLNKGSSSSSDNMLGTPTLRSSSGYGSTTDFGSNVTLDRTISNLVGHKQTNLSFISTSTTTAAFRLTAFGYRSSSYADIHSSYMRPAGLSPSHPSTSYFPYYHQYQRTYSGGAKIRCSSADPQISNLALQYLSSRSQSLVGRKSREREGSRSGSEANSRGTSAERCGGGSVSGGGRTLVARNPFAPVTELARNVSSYNWDNGGKTYDDQSDLSFISSSSRPSLFSRQSSTVTTASVTETDTLHGSIHSGINNNNNGPIPPVYHLDTYLAIQATAQKLSLANGTKYGRVEEKKTRIRQKAVNSSSSVNGGMNFISSLTPQDEQTLFRVSKLLSGFKPYDII